MYVCTTLVSDFHRILPLVSCLHQPHLFTWTFHLSLFIPLVSPILRSSVWESTRDSVPPLFSHSHHCPIRLWQSSHLLGPSCIPLPSCRHPCWVRCWQYATIELFTLTSEDPFCNDLQVSWCAQVQVRLSKTEWGLLPPLWLVFYTWRYAIYMSKQMVSCMTQPDH